MNSNLPPDEGSIIITGVGQAGSQMAASFWVQLCKDHKINPKTGYSEEGATGHWQKLFTTGPNDRFVPRCLFVDSDPRTSDDLKRNWSELFNPANFVTGVESSGNNFAVAVKEVGDRLNSDIREVLDREFRKPPAPTAFIVFHGYGGGSGSGLAAGLFEILKEYAPAAAILSVGVLPSMSVSSAVTEPYNAVFGVEAALRHISLGLVFHNDILLELAQAQWGVENPSISHINEIISDIMIAMTGSVRFSGDGNPAISLSTIISDLAPHPDFPLTTGTIFPLRSILRKNASVKTSGQILNQVLEKNLDLCPCTDGTILSLAIFGSSRAGMPGLLKSNDDFGPKGDAAEAEIPHFARLHLSAEPSPNSSICILVNSSSIGNWLQELCERFDQLWKRKAFANWYLEAGMTEFDIDSRRRELGFRAERYQDI